VVEVGRALERLGGEGLRDPSRLSEEAGLNAVSRPLRGLWTVSPVEPRGPDSGTESLPLAGRLGDCSMAAPSLDT
jgi:hypothetical protein